MRRHRQARIFSPRRRHGNSTPPTEFGVDGAMPRSRAGLSSALTKDRLPAAATAMTRTTTTSFDRSELIELDGLIGDAIDIEWLILLAYVVLYLMWHGRWIG